MVAQKWIRGNWGGEKGEGRAAQKGLADPPAVSGLLCGNQAVFMSGSGLGPRLQQRTGSAMPQGACCPVGRMHKFKFIAF